ncbi:MAG: elongation factor P [Patescibacteria group bacterium]|nr:elongation factor P [Patescibacteria group bacterium]
MSVLSTLNDIKLGIAIVYNGEPYVVLTANFVRMQQRKPVMQTKLRNLINGKVLEITFKPGDRIEEAEVGRKDATFLYTTDAEVHFMDGETFEQISLPKADVTASLPFLREGTPVQLRTFNEKPIGLELPAKMDFKVTAAPEAVKGDSAQGRVTKIATIETGAEIPVPLFINEGDVIRINTQTGEYVERVNK